MPQPFLLAFVVVIILCAWVAYHNSIKYKRDRQFTNAVWSALFTVHVIVLSACGLWIAWG